MAESLERMQSLPTRQWSTSSLLRGASFLKDQAKKESMDYQDVLAVARLLLSHFLEGVMHWETAITLNPRLQEHASRSWLLRSLRRRQRRLRPRRPLARREVNLRVRLLPKPSLQKTTQMFGIPRNKQRELLARTGLGFPKNVPCWGGLPLPKKQKTLKKEHPRLVLFLGGAVGQVSKNAKHVRAWYLARRIWKTLKKLEMPWQTAVSRLFNPNCGLGTVTSSNTQSYCDQSTQNGWCTK